MIEEISSEEALEFFRTLEKEKETFWLDEEQIASSHILIGDKSGGEIRGIGGVRKQHSLPVSWIAVKAEHQNRKVGYNLLHRVNEMAVNRHSFLLATILEQNMAAQRIAEKNDYRTAGVLHGRCYLVHPIDGLGSLLWWLLVRLFGIFLKLKGEGSKHS